MLPSPSQTGCRACAGLRGRAGLRRGSPAPAVARAASSQAGPLLPLAVCGARTGKTIITVEELAPCLSHGRKSHLPVHLLRAQVSTSSFTSSAPSWTTQRSSGARRAPTRCVPTALATTSEWLGIAAQRQPGRRSHPACSASYSPCRARLPGHWATAANAACTQRAAQSRRCAVHVRAARPASGGALSLGLLHCPSSPARSYWVPQGSIFEWKDFVSFQGEG